MKSKKSLLYKVVALVLVLAIAAVMFVIGRGHTIYLDNKALEYDGKTYDCPYKVTAFIKGEQVAKLYEKERGMGTWMGQNFKVTLEVIETKGGDEVTAEYSLKLPYSMDGIVVNIPALMAGLPEDTIISQFVSLIAEAPVEEEVIIDEFAIPESDAAVAP